MSIILHTIFWLSFSVLIACVGFQQQLSPEVSGFIQLLVKIDEPTLAEYAKFSGNCGGEPELIFSLDACEANGWNSNSQSCINFTRKKCEMPDQEPSLKLSWLRERFSTVGKKYRLVGTQSESEGFNHDIVEVENGWPQGRPALSFRHYKPV